MAASASEALLKSPVVRVFWGVSFKKLFLQLLATVSMKAAASARKCAGDRFAKKLAISGKPLKSVLRTRPFQGLLIFCFCIIASLYRLQRYIETESDGF